MQRVDVRKFLTKSYKRLECARYLIYEVSADKITIIDVDRFYVPYKWVAKKLIKKYNVEMVVFRVGSVNGNGWMFTKSSLNIK